MDEQKVREAIKELNSLLEIANGLYKEKKNTGYKTSAERYKTAIEALEKQLPKKPLEVKNSPIPSEKTYYCPICSGRFVNRGVVGYCYHCGQLLDWSE